MTAYGEEPANPVDIPADLLGHRVSLRHRVGDRDGRPLFTDAVGDRCFPATGPATRRCSCTRDAGRCGSPARPWSAVRAVPPAPPRRPSLGGGGPPGAAVRRRLAGAGGPSAGRLAAARRGRLHRAGQLRTGRRGPRAAGPGGAGRGARVSPPSTGSRRGCWLRWARRGTARSNARGGGWRSSTRPGPRWRCWSAIWTPRGDGADGRGGAERAAGGPVVAAALGRDPTAAERQVLGGSAGPAFGRASATDGVVPGDRRRGPPAPVPAGGAPAGAAARGGDRAHRGGRRLGAGARSTVGGAAGRPGEHRRAGLLRRARLRRAPPVPLPGSPGVSSEPLLPGAGRALEPRPLAEVLPDRAHDGQQPEPRRGRSGRAGACPARPPARTAPRPSRHTALPTRAASVALRLQLGGELLGTGRRRGVLGGRLGPTDGRGARRNSTAPSSATSRSSSRTPCSPAIATSSSALRGRAERLGDRQPARHGTADPRHRGHQRGEPADAADPPAAAGRRRPSRPTPPSRHLHRGQRVEHPRPAAAVAVCPPTRDRSPNGSASRSPSSTGSGGPHERSQQATIAPSDRR